MNYLILFLSILLSFSFTACGNEESEVCYSFDERQCGVDPFTINGSLDDKEEAIEEYLKAQGFNDPDVAIEDNFYDAVCEACTICPEQYRIFVEIEEEDASILESLDLFNLMLENCGN